MGEVIGYGRVSSVGQSLEVQLVKLNEYGCGKIFSEKKSGTSTSTRWQLRKCLDYVREGDTLVITKLDRLCRSVCDLTRIGEDLKTRGVHLVVIDQQIDTSTPTGKLMFHMLAVIGEFENELRKERQLDGIQAAKSKGVKFGRKKKLSGEEVIKMKRERHDDGVLIKDLARKYDISINSVYRLMRGAT